jgi:hypothetical protein
MPESPNRCALVRDDFIRIGIVGHHEDRMLQSPAPVMSVTIQAVHRSPVRGTPQGPGDAIGGRAV